jgi:hypothetical protein
MRVRARDNSIRLGEWFDEQGGHTRLHWETPAVKCDGTDGSVTSPVIFYKIALLLNAKRKLLIIRDSLVSPSGFEPETY